MGFVLDLTDADTSGFDALDPGKYLAEIYEVEEIETAGGENAKLPAGVPMLNVKWVISAPEEVEGKKAFQNLVLPPEDLEYDEKKIKKMKGTIVRTLLGCGYSEEELSSDSFDLDPDDLVGRSACITLSRYEYPKKSGIFRNNIVGVNPVDTYDGDASSGVL